MPAEKASFTIKRTTSAIRTPIILQKTSDSLRSDDLTKKRDLAKKLTPVSRFLTLFLALKIRPRPHMNRQKYVRMLIANQELAAVNNRTLLTFSFT